MELKIEKSKKVNHQVRLPDDLNDFVLKISKKEKCSKSEAIRSMIRACLIDFKSQKEESA